MRRLAVCQIRNLVTEFCREQFDRNNFMQNILLGNMLDGGHVRQGAEGMHIMEGRAVMVFVIEAGGKNNDSVAHGNW